MKKCFSRYRLALFVLSVMSSITFAKVVWEGSDAPDVFDQDLVIKGNVTLRSGGTTIQAIHTNITVRLEEDVTISGSSSGESQLYFKVAAGKRINFIVNNNLTFLGSGDSHDDLLIVQSGPGLVDVAIAENREFKIASKQGSGGVQMFVLMFGGESAFPDEYCDEYSCDEYCVDEYNCVGTGQNEKGSARPRLRFRALNAEEYSDANRKIIIGKKSRLSFLSSRLTDFAQDSATIEFDPASASLGRMILEIKDTGAFIVAGHFTCQRNGGCITLNSIDLARPAGQEAIWSIVNSSFRNNFSAGLLVLNKNKTMFDLLQTSFDNNNISRCQLHESPSPDECDVEESPSPDDNCHPHESHSHSHHMRPHDFSGNRLGVVVGANGALWTKTNAYLDYVGLALNQKSKNPKICEENHNEKSHHTLKARNPSALFIDGNPNPCSIPAKFLFSASSAVFFRSGIANDGTIRDENDVDPFTIDECHRTRGVGNIVFDVEGQLDAQGLSDEGAFNSKIELLSLEVVPTGGALFADSSESVFPRRTFNTEDGELLAYNTGAFLINNTMNLFNTSLSHTDVNHTVVQDNDVISEPAYIGGEAFKLWGSHERPSIRFFNSRLLVNADIALTGLDLVVPNLVDSNGFLHKNNSDFVFYSSGSCVDNGTGRQMILGTQIGSTARNGMLIDNDAHLDVIQLFDAIGADFPITETDNQTLHLLTGFNSFQITNIRPQPGFSINTIFLGNTSNISIGTNADSTGFNIDTNPWLRIQGNFFSFTTRGGLNGCPNTSNVTGQGGIFVDLNGKLSIDPGVMATFCVLVTRTHNGIVDLPPGQVFFCDDLGIINGNIDLSMMSGQILVAPGEFVADLVLDWQLLKKDCPNFNPFQPVGPCCPPVTQANVSSLPIIEGTVDNLIIRGSRLGDAATFIIRGGLVRNIQFAVENTCCVDECENLSGQAPVATVILEDNGIVTFTGEGAGATGITIIANGSGRVELAGDVTIATQCAFVKGPNFVEGNALTINSDIAHEIILPSSGVLDLRSFDAPTDLVQFTGAAQFAIEPGATIIVGQGTLSFANDSQIHFETAQNAMAFFQAIPHGSPHDPALPPLEIIPAADIHNQYDFLTNFGEDLHNTDKFRIRLMGKGIIELRDNAQGFIPFNAFVGVETTNSNDTCEVITTDLELRLLNNAQFSIGALNISQGGVLQIGNVDDQNINPVTRQGTKSVSFTLTLDGPEAHFLIGSQGFMGLGVGIERFDGTNELNIIVPNENIVNTLFNVKSITFDFVAGRFEHDRMFRGDDPNASLFAINGDETISYNLIFNDLSIASNFNIAGGGNMILTFPGVGGLHPIVLDQDGQVEVAPGVFDPRLWVGIMASSALQNNMLEQRNLTGLEFFELLKTHDAVLEINRPNTFGRANASGDFALMGTPINVRIDTVANGEIIRNEVFDIIGTGNELSKQQQTEKIAAVFVNIDPNTNEIITVTQMGG